MSVTFDSVQILKYITQENRWYEIPKRLLLAIWHQIYKRLTQGIISHRLPNGAHIFLYPNCPISSAFVYSGLPDRKEIGWLRQHSNKEKTIFLDIGANMGSYSALLSDKAHAIYAFEPHPAAFQRCQMNFLLNHLSLQHVFRVALCQKKGTRYFKNEGAYGAPTNRLTDSAMNGIVVTATTLDDFANTHFLVHKNVEYLLKIDVEGAEAQVLQGAKEFLSTYPIAGILFECFDANLKAVKQILQTYGFRITHLNHHNYFAKKQ
ncbi:MAG: FkbM family methyltransferase [Gammaproteobacteria bacterium]